MANYYWPFQFSVLNVSFILSPVNSFSLAFPNLCSSVWVAVSSISSGIREERRGGVRRIVQLRLPGSHAFVIKLLILCYAGHAPLWTSASDFSFLIPFDQPLIANRCLQINPILLHFWLSQVTQCYLLTCLPNSSILNALALFLELFFPLEGATITITITPCWHRSAHAPKITAWLHHSGDKHSGSVLL